MSTNTPRALEMADCIDPLTRKTLDNLTCAVAATELRRLAAVEAERDALRAELERIRALEPVGRVAWIADVEGTMKEARWDDPCGPAIGTQLFDLTQPKEQTT